MSKDAHFQLTRLARLSAAYDLHLCRWLLAGLRDQVCTRAGFESFADYAEKMFGFEPRHVAARIRVALALEGLPRLAAALGDGLLRWAAVREVSRVATPQSVDAWIDFAERVSLDELRRQVKRGHIPCNYHGIDQTSGPLGRLDIQCEVAELSSLMSKPQVPIEVGIR